jgi:hypothetical protein
MYVVYGVLFSINEHAPQLENTRSNLYDLYRPPSPERHMCAPNNRHRASGASVGKDIRDRA